MYIHINDILLNVSISNLLFLYAVRLLDLLIFLQHIHLASLQFLDVWAVSNFSPL